MDYNRYSQPSAPFVLHPAIQWSHQFFQFQTRYVRSASSVLKVKWDVSPIIGTSAMPARGHALSTLDKIGPIRNATKKPTA